MHLLWKEWAYYIKAVVYCINQVSLIYLILIQFSLKKISLTCTGDMWEKLLSSQIQGNTRWVIDKHRLRFNSSNKSHEPIPRDVEKQEQGRGVRMGPAAIWLSRWRARLGCSSNISGQGEWEREEGDAGRRPERGQGVQAAERCGWMEANRWKCWVWAGGMIIGSVWVCDTASL